MLGQSGQIQQAIVDSEALLHDELRILGPDHLDTLTTRHNLAYFFAQSGQIDRAIADYEQLLPDQQRILGDDHPHILRNQKRLIALRETDQSSERV
jgi:Tetratricopeptide repeat